MALIISLLYDLIDTIWVAGLGPKALSAMGFISPIYLFLVSIGVGIGAASSSLISISIGAKDHKHANNVGLHAILLGGILSIIPVSLVLFFLKPLLIFIGAGNVLSYAIDYSQIIFLFLFVFIYSNLGSSFFRAEGNVKRATRAVVLGSILDVILDPIFIYTFNLGMKGAAIATVLSVLISCIIMAYWLWIKKDNYLELSYKHFKLDYNIIKEIISLAIPTTLETTIYSLLSLFINYFIMQVSNHVSVAVFTSSSQILQFTTMPLTAISTALLTVAGVSYGAKNFENLKTAHSFTIRIGFLLAIISSGIMVIFSSPIATVFSYSSKSVGLAPQIASTLCILSLYVISIPHGLMSSALFKSIGKGTYCLILTIIRSLLLEVVCAYLFCFIFGWGLTGIYTGLIIGSFLGSVVGYVWAKVFIINKLEHKQFKEYIHEKRMYK
ncbi:MATE family efflux transporter [uncultured Methanobrevibacter sp.]|uniref:MATE family efflux transporter n=1 Tax=uncultured Methanobrevibacter sp. TaxID=253161 RepID=UPI0025F09014|nr:MATE family efflux transporter [uncultured Methanobrevibacter sp.]